MPNAEGRMEEQTVDAQIEAALRVVNELCDGSRRWTLSVPARPDSDPDLVIAGALEAARTALAARTREVEAMRAENERMRADLDAVRKVVQLQADRDWIIVPWLNDAGDYVWRVNVRDVPSKKKGADTYTGTEHVGATPLDAGLRALAAQEGTR